MKHIDWRNLRKNKNFDAFELSFVGKNLKEASFFSFLLINTKFKVFLYKINYSRLRIDFVLLFCLKSDYFLDI